MTRQAHLTVLERGASPTAWASGQGLAADDWIVVAQQSDESVPQFLKRVAERANRLRKHDTVLNRVDVYTAPESDIPAAEARRSVIEVLGTQIVAGGQLTLWAAPGQNALEQGEMGAILALFQPLLAGRQIAMNRQTCDAEPASGVRHAVPRAPEGYAIEQDFEPIT